MLILHERSGTRSASDLNPGKITCLFLQHESLYVVSRPVCASTEHFARAAEDGGQTGGRLLDVCLVYGRHEADEGSYGGQQTPGQWYSSVNV